MATTTTTAGAPARPGELLSERIAPGILPKVLGPFDMVAIFVAIVLFAVQGSVVQQAGASAFVYWILGFLTFLIPGAIVTGQLGLMFPGEGSIYVWTNKALGAFWGFFAGFCAWWPGALVMVATARPGRDIAPVLADAASIQLRESAGCHLAAGRDHPGGHLVLVGPLDPAVPRHPEPRQRRLCHLRRRDPDSRPGGPRLAARWTPGRQRRLDEGHFRPQLGERHLLRSRH